MKITAKRKANREARQKRKYNDIGAVVTYIDAVVAEAGLSVSVDNQTRSALDKIRKAIR